MACPHGSGLSAASAYLLFLSPDYTPELPVYNPSDNILPPRASPPFAPLELWSLVVLSGKVVKPSGGRALLGGGRGSAGTGFGVSVPGLLPVHSLVSAYDWSVAYSLSLLFATMAWSSQTLPFGCFLSDIIDATRKVTTASLSSFVANKPTSGYKDVFLTG